MKAPRGAFMRSALMEFYSGTPTENLSGVDTNHRSEVIEKSLAHEIPNKVEAAYRRGDLLAKRRALMCDWADYVCLLDTADHPSLITTVTGPHGHDDVSFWGTADDRDDALGGF
jgi:hypothetical protein